MSALLEGKNLADILGKRAKTCETQKAHFYPPSFYNELKISLLCEIVQCMDI